MKLIALEASVSPGSLAAWEQLAGAEQPAVTASPLPPDQRTARSLATALRSLLDQQGWKVADLDAVAVTTGPGSFTGLRIAVTAAKSLAYAAGCPAAPLNTLAVLAAQAPAGSRGWAVMDAQRNEVFAAPFEGNQLTGETVILPEQAWLDTLEPNQTVIGPLLTKLADRLPEGVSPAPESAWRPDAATAARLGAAAIERGGTVSPFELVPEYFRKSAAEEKADAKA